MVNNQVIVLIVVVAAGASVLCGYAVTRFFFSDPPRQNGVDANGEFSQAAYMREVRLRNQDNVAAVMGFGRQDIVCSLALQSSRSVLTTDPEGGPRSCSIWLLLKRIFMW